MRDLKNNYDTLITEYDLHLSGDTTARHRFIDAAIPLIQKIAEYAARASHRNPQIVGDMVNDCVIRVNEFLDQTAKAENAVASLITTLKRSCKGTSIGDRCFGEAVGTELNHRSKCKAQLKQSRSADIKICTSCDPNHATGDFYYITNLNHPRGGSIECRQAHEDRVRRETREVIYHEDIQFEELQSSSDIEEAIERLREFATEDDITIVRLKTSGLSDREIADELGISRQSVQAKRKKLAQSLSLGA